MSRLQEYYRDTVVGELKEKLGLDNVMAVPRIEKITINMGVGEAVGDRKVMDLSLIHISEPTRRRDSSRMPSTA